jgi:hypothetical protein
MYGTITTRVEISQIIIYRAVIPVSIRPWLTIQEVRTMHVYNMNIFLFDLMKSHVTLVVYVLLIGGFYLLIHAEIWLHCEIERVALTGKF